MAIYIPEIWIWVCIAFGVVLLTMLIMGLQEKFFFTKDVILRKFNILDLQFASTSQEIINIIKGVRLLPEEKAKKAMSALKSQLYVDFIFMPAVYGGVFLLSMKVSQKMSSIIGEDFFAALAWLQIVPWLCDIYENVYLLNKLKPFPKVAEPKAHKFFQNIVGLKWGISLLAAICSIAALFYFWLAGLYSTNSLQYVIILCSELAIFIVINKILSTRLKEMVKE